MVNGDTVEKAIGTISLNVKELRQAADIDRDKYRTDIRARRFVERSLQVIIEACIDIAQHIISDDGMREPVSYRDTFVVLCENGIVPEEELGTYEKIAMFRNLLVHYYEKVDDEIVFGIFRKNLGDFDRYVGYILKYLEKVKGSG
jgi:uncharacterized protein YutE (UPF0331/DUF86 family)